MVFFQAYNEATEHFLTALKFQSAGRGPVAAAAAATSNSSSSVMSESIWSSLRLCMSLLDRRDLLPDVENRNLERINSALIK